LSTYHIHHDDHHGDGTPPSIDDYYSRRHLSQKVPLVVGGSDGSGTRAFVEILRQLGVPMLSDDPISLDVHGDTMMGGMGWPPLARAVLRETRSSNYQLDHLSDSLRNMTITELTALYNKFRIRGKKLKGNVDKVTFGFKAPVSMLLVPILRQVLGPMRYLHIVRDGRDVSLSQNQSPVQKFYNDSYDDAQERRMMYSDDFDSVMGMQLWNDWNTGLLDYERTHADGRSFDFLVMRTEDLLNPETKFEALVQLADFVGSTYPLRKLCCISLRRMEDMTKKLKRPTGWLRKKKSGTKSGFSRSSKNTIKGTGNPHSGRRLTQVRVANADTMNKTVTRNVKAKKRRASDEEHSIMIPEQQQHQRRRLWGWTRLENNIINTVVANRYGKWVSLLQEKPDVSRRLHKEGAKGLAAFGYEPARSFQDEKKDLDYECYDTFFGCLYI
jgi:hypothetical protein